MSNWYLLREHNDIISPALLFHPRGIEKNIQSMLSIAGSADRLRPHVKTYKCQEIVQMQMHFGIHKFKCATLREAHMLAEAGVKDILVAYPLVGPSQSKYLQLQDRYPDCIFSSLIDHPDQLEEWASRTQEKLDFFIDLNVGMNRTGVKTRASLSLLFPFIENDQFNLRGLHIYDGHIHEKDLEKREKLVDEAFSPVNTLLTAASWLTDLELICGGSISFPIHAKHPERTLSPGTTLLWDRGYQAQFPDLNFDIAACLLARVVSKPAANYLCLDIGYKAVAAEMEAPLVHLPQFPNVEIIGKSEEHLLIKTELSQATQFKIGDVIYAFPWHICPTVALHEFAFIVEEQKITGKWEVNARNRFYQI